MSSQSINEGKQANLFEGVNDSKEDWFNSVIDVYDLEIDSGWVDVFGTALNHSLSTNKTKPRVLGLFSGAGGLDIGFHDAGFDIVECNELEKDFAATLIKNAEDGALLSGTKVICDDIRNYSPNLENIDFIIGGPPCQTFSAAGARAAGVNGLDDERGNLFQEYVRILKKIKPKGFLFENVYRIVGAQGGEPWKQIQKAFKDCGYTLHWRILDAADYGVPQHRERLIIVGTRDSHYQFPYPTHGPDAISNRPFYNAQSALDNLEESLDFKTLNGRHGYLLKDIPPGLNYSFYTERMRHPKPIFGWRSKFSDYLYKADPEKPVRTIKAQGGQYTGPFHWNSRTFTLPELKRLQTFPDDYEVIGKRQKVIHQLGNSVPPQLARILALSIMDQIFQGNLPFKIDYMDESYQLGFRGRKSKLTKIYAEKARLAIEKMGVSPEMFINKNGFFYASLSKEMELNIAVKECNKSTRISYTIENGVWTLDTTSNSKRKYEIVAVNVDESITDIKSIRMISHSSDYITLSKLWKSLEYLVKKYAHKDDLVQLFGYYQYKQKFKLEFIVTDDEINNNLWQLVKRITEGKGTGDVISYKHLAESYGFLVTDLKDCLVELKNIGFEIRNNNTNGQIPIGDVLIPYSFPTLNERSLQRFTEL